MKGAGATRGMILVVEDEAAISRAAQKRLRDSDYGLVLVDSKTPVMDGREFYRFLVKKRPGLARRVIFTTGDIVDREIGDFLELSGRPLLPKPFSPEDLKAIVSRTLSGEESDC